MATERLALLLETIGTSSVVRDLEKVSGATKGLGEKATSASGLLKKLGAGGEGAGGALGGAFAGGVAAAGSALIAFGVKSVQTYTELGQSVLKFQRASGATAEQASALIAAFDDVGISADTGSKGIFQLGKRLDAQADTLKSYGVSAAYGADGNVNLAETLLNVADAYTKTQDPAERAQLLAAAFGKSGQDLIPILERGRAGIEAMFSGAERTGQILSQADVDKAEQYRLAMDELGDAVRSLSIAAGQFLVPAITSIADALAGAIEKGTDLKDRLGELPIVGGALSDVGKGIHAVLNGLGGGSHDASTAQRELDESIHRATARLEEEKQSAEDLRTSVFGLVAAHRASEQASRSLTDAQGSLADKQKTLDDLTRKGAVDQKAVAAATRDLTDAQRGATSALNAQGDAQEKVNKAQEALRDLTSGKVGAEKTADAHDDLTRAQLRQRTATQRVVAAQNEYNKVSIDGASTAYDLTNAQIDLDSANFDLAQSNQDLTTAQESLNKAEQIGAENSPEVIGARKTLKGANDDLTTATNNVADANQKVIDKQTALGTALAGDPNFTETVRKARQDVADATQHVSDATYDVAQKAYDAEQKQKAFNTAMDEGGKYAKNLRDELDQLQKSHPELAPLFAPITALLQSALLTALPGVGTPGKVPKIRVGPSVPTLADGGIIPASPGGTLARIGEGGRDEAVIPLPSRGALGGTVISVTVNAGIAGDTDRVAAAIHGALSRMAKSGWSSPWNN